MINLLKSIFNLANNFKKYELTNKFQVGDICMWPGRVDGCEDAVVEIQNWYHDIDEKTGEEVIKYEFIDIYRNIEYSDVEEKELSILAFKEEVLENISPYQLETAYMNAA